MIVGVLSMHDDDGFSGYEDDVNDHINKGFHGKENVIIEISPPARETIEFPKVLVTQTTMGAETQHTFERMQKLMSTGIVAMIVMGACFLVSSGLCTYFGIRYVQLENERIVEEIRLKNGTTRQDTSSGVMPFGKPKDHP